MAKRPYVQITNKHLADLRERLTYLRIEHLELPIATQLQHSIDLLNTIQDAINKDAEYVEEETSNSSCNYGTDDSAFTCC